MPQKIRIYLAGPEVFLPNARQALQAKADLTTQAGFTPVSPGDADVSAHPTKHARGLAISAIDEDLMNSSDAIIANLTPFRGPGADPGTAYELGYMCAQNKPAFAYSNDPRNHFQRIIHHYNGQVTRHGSGHTRGTDGLAAADFDMVDNLMLHGGVESRGGTIVIGNAPDGAIYTDLTAFKKVLKIAVKKLL